MCTSPYFGTSSIQKPIYFKYQICGRRSARRGGDRHAASPEYGPSSSSILPTEFPMFNYDYQEYNTHRTTRSTSGFISEEYIEANVVVYLKNSRVNGISEE